jgi:hypothetical protein
MKTPSRLRRNRGYALRRKSEARTRPRNSSAISAGGVGAGFGFTMADFATFADLRAASRASRLVANSFASASIASAGEPSRATRWSLQSMAWQ